MSKHQRFCEIPPELVAQHLRAVDPTNADKTSVNVRDAEEVYNRSIQEIVQQSRGK